MHYIVFGVAFLTCASLAHAQEWSPSRVDSHAPIGVMGDHVHEAGEVMLSFRAMHMRMDGNRSDGAQKTVDEVLVDYPVAPLNMPMTMYMAGFMYAPTSRVTVMGMLPVLQSSMDHRMRNGTEFTTESGGVGDLSVSALVALGEGNRSRWHLNLGMGFPTGSIDERDDTPAASDVRLPYPMQVGSGALDVLPRLTYLAQREFWSWGAQGRATIHLGENDNDYSLGERAALTTWGSVNLRDELSASLRLSVESWSNVTGADTTLNPRMVPTADPDLRGGAQADLGIGINIYARGSTLTGHRLAMEWSTRCIATSTGPNSNVIGD